MSAISNASLFTSKIWEPGTIHLENAAELMRRIYAIAS